MRFSLLTLCRRIPGSLGDTFHGGQCPFTVPEPGGSLPVGRSCDGDGYMRHRPVGIWFSGRSHLCVFVCPCASQNGGIQLPVVTVCVLLSKFES